MAIRDMIKDKVVLVTGGTGTVGHVLVRELLRHSPKSIRIFSRDETKQFEMMNEFIGSEDKLRFLIGDVRDKERLGMAAENVDYIFHLAAMKHVLLSSYNPFEAVKTNIIGTQHLIEVARQQDVAGLLYTSTDKAVNSSNPMGVSKLVAEHLVTTANCYRGRHRTVFASVRFGNVLGSRGSAIPLFLKQIKNGQPVTLTNPLMTRFVMTGSQASQLMLKALEMAQGGEIFVFKMPKVRLNDLVDAICGHLGRQVETKIIGEMPYEKKDEELMTLDESQRALESEDMFIVLPPKGIQSLIGARYAYDIETRPAEVCPYSSNAGPFLSSEDTVAILRAGQVLAEHAA